MTATASERDELNGLLVRTGRGDQASFAELYRRAAPKLYGVCLRMARDRGDADEVLQETFITVWHRAATFDPGKASAMTWLTTLARNKGIDRLRQHREETLGDPDHLNTLVDEDPTPAAGAEASQEYGRLARCLEALEPQQKRSVREAFFSGATYKELAARLDVPLGTMKSWIRRGLLQLRACLDS
ncbi:RNA polymerase sigma-70 factor (ECF subfamily) [Luteibacter sp. Sphag1AF]|uniref:sigma-70 family RNA polymerase sigma factor n=1 Tax=Luteibacter sp. Sphag1AF TaxID=2587031 RepID=UPI00161F8520|nr:sigma-70 family RNA polymerase sigma factor [Luteibacter sp. Sphag1AF]MBB3226486.1 RNA polymerase sigma-70 factor (ECF subfamily) [Luteibacter sp. Sphag1AF]